MPKTIKMIDLLQYALDGARAQRGLMRIDDDGDKERERLSHDIETIRGMIAAHLLLQRVREVKRAAKKQTQPKRKSRAK